MAILGPTASGKTEMAIEVARHMGAEIISVDSMQVYRGMNIGTAKPTIMERKGVTHHMVDIVDPAEEYSVAEFRRAGRAVIETTAVPVVITGGSGLHFRALVDPMSFAPTDPALRHQMEETELGQLTAELLAADAEAGEHVDLSNKRRVVRAVEVFRLSGETPSGRAASEEANALRRYVPEMPFTAVGVDPGELTEERVDQRLALMRDGGLVDEVRGLAAMMGKTARGAVGYKEILQALDGEVTIDEAFEEIGRNTKRLAKKQRTWFQRDPRIQWLPWTEDRDARIERALQTLG